MSSLTPVGTRPQTTSTLPALAQAGGKAYGLQVAPASGNVAARLPVVDPVTLQNKNVSLSTQSLQRTGELAADTLDAAQNLIDTFVNNLFGDQAKGARVDFDSVSLEAQSSFSASATRSADGASRSGAFSLNESASFTGKGQLVTADGQTFDFEIEIKYEASIQASAQTTSVDQQASTGQERAASVGAPDLVVLTGKPLPAIKYPGSLDDLFKLLGKELSGSVKGNEGGADEAQLGNITLRLQRLVDRAALLAPRPQAEELAAAPVERSKVASSYAAQAGGAIS